MYLKMTVGKLLVVSELFNADANDFCVGKSFRSETSVQCVAEPLRAKPVANKNAFFACYHLVQSTRER